MALRHYPATPDVVSEFNSKTITDSWEDNLTLNNIHVAIVSFKNIRGFWIVPAPAEDDKRFGAAVGPFPSVEVAAVAIKLS